MNNAGTNNAHWMERHLTVCIEHLHLLVWVVEYDFKFPQKDWIETFLLSLPIL